MGEEKRWNLLDAMTFVGFFLGVANYGENISQSDLQETMGNVLKDVHRHLEEQDKKLNDILEMLNELREG